jgi:hypothetical protein
MKLSRISLIITAALLARISSAQEVKQMTVDQIVAKNVEAKGGAEALHALQTVKLIGKMLVNEGQLELAFSQTKKRPSSVRNEYTLQGMTAVQAYDGTDGWKISPFQDT